MITQIYPLSGHARPRATADFLKVSTVTLPKSIRLSERVTVYDAAEIRAWLEAKKHN